jgi:hypothetical protein
VEGGDGGDHNAMWSECRREGGVCEVIVEVSVVWSVVPMWGDASGRTGLRS